MALPQKKRLLSLLLSGTILTGWVGAAEAPPPDEKTVSYKEEFNKAANRQIELSGGKYTRPQAEARVFNARAGKFNYPDRDKNPAVLKKAFEKCAQTDYAADQVPEDVRGLWQNMQVLKNSKSMVGLALADFAAQTDIFYCYDSQPDGQAASWTDGEGIVRMADGGGTSPEYKILIQAHETIHAIQKTTGTSDEKETWSLAEMQISKMSYEAAAVVGERILWLDLYNAKQEGLPSRESYSALDHTLKAYETALEKNMSPGEALTEAGTVEFYEQFKKQSWLDFYNHHVLNRYIYLLTNDFVKPSSGEAFTIDIAKKTGYISPEINFTAKLDHLPPYEERFGTNTRMRQAFDYVENERFAYMRGWDHPAYLKGLEKLKEEKNPYIGVDLKKVYADKSARKILEKMDDVANRRNHPALVPKMAPKYLS